MAQLIVSDEPTEGSRTLIAEDVHPAICTDMIYIGTVDDEFEGKATVREKVWIGFEIPGEKREDKDGNPYCASIGEMFTLSLGEKSKLRPFLESWRNKKFTPEELKGFDLMQLPEKPVQLSIVHATKNGKTRAKISTVMKFVGQIPKRTNPLRIIGKGEFDQAVFDSLPKFIQEEIEKSREYRAMKDPGSDDAVRATFAKPADHGPIDTPDEDQGDLPF